VDIGVFRSAYADKMLGCVVIKPATRSTRGHEESTTRTHSSLARGESASVLVSSNGDAVDATANLLGRQLL
jgi:hypothetical protein